MSSGIPGMVLIWKDIGRLTPKERVCSQICLDRSKNSLSVFDFGDAVPAPSVECVDTPKLE